MMRLLIPLLLALAACAPAPSPQQVAPPETLPATVTGPDVATWPQVGNGPDHAGFQPQTVANVNTIQWRHPFQPELVAPQVQAIVNASKVIVGTMGGHVYAFLTSANTLSWTFPASGAIGPVSSSVAATATTVYVASMDGAAYAINIADGTQVWKQQLSTRGLSAAPLMDDNATPTAVYFAGRDGTLYALNPTDGHISWQWTHPTHAPLLMTPAFSAGKVIVPAMDMRVYGIDTTTHATAWTSAKLQGMAMKDYWPMVVGTTVVVRPQPATARYASEDGGIQVSDYLDATQIQALAAYDASPNSNSISFDLLNLTTGTTLAPPVHWNWSVDISGANSPGCVDRNGTLIMPAQRPATWNGITLTNSWKAGWARLSLASRKITEPLIDPTPIVLSSGLTTLSENGYGNKDENMVPTCVTNGVYVLHAMEGNAQYTGFFNLDTHAWTSITPGGSDRRGPLWQGGGASMGTIAGGRMFHLVWHELVVRSAS